MDSNTSPTTQDNNHNDASHSLSDQSPLKSHTKQSMKVSPQSSLSDESNLEEGNTHRRKKKKSGDVSLSDDSGDSRQTRRKRSRKHGDVLLDEDSPEGYRTKRRRKYKRKKMEDVSISDDSDTRKRRRKKSKKHGDVSSKRRKKIEDISISDDSDRRRRKKKSKKDEDVSISDESRGHRKRRRRKSKTGEDISHSGDSEEGHTKKRRKKSEDVSRKYKSKILKQESETDDQQKKKRRYGLSPSGYSGSDDSGDGHIKKRRKKSQKPDAKSTRYNEKSVQSDKKSKKRKRSENKSDASGKKRKKRKLEVEDSITISKSKKNGKKRKKKTIGNNADSSEDIASLKVGMENEDFCGVCSEPGNLLCCDGCTLAFHFKCLDPPVKKDFIGDEDWFCYNCKPRSATKLKGLFSSLNKKLKSSNPVPFMLPGYCVEYDHFTEKLKRISEISHNIKGKNTLDQSNFKGLSRKSEVFIEQNNIHFEELLSDNAVLSPSVPLSKVANSYFQNLCRNSTVTTLYYLTD
eukprot:TRINITY_DN2889_c0_g1_i1.p1 TRINITY_DN2889_c0_g1~~TRINITY_DN2889_c0_g1_i1.p1  ORF type:complete len:518 (+),score=133.67 TRINITY_DN2889_c0_g1_i1:115-1668(+)